MGGWCICGVSVVGFWMLFVLCCCLLFVVDCLMLVVRCWLFVVGCVLMFVEVRSSLFVDCCLWFVFVS